MYRNESFVRAYQRLAGSAARPPSLLQKVLGVVVAGAIFVVMLMFSMVAFAAVAAVGLVVWGWLWWKTRELRKQMRSARTHPPGGPHPPGGLVLEGEVIREVRGDDDAPESGRGPSR